MISIVLQLPLLPQDDRVSADDISIIASLFSAKSCPLAFPLSSRLQPASRLVGPLRIPYIYLITVIWSARERGGLCRLYYFIFIDQSSVSISLSTMNAEAEWYALWPTALRGCVVSEERSHLPSDGDYFVDPGSQARLQPPHLDRYMPYIIIAR